MTKSLRRHHRFGEIMTKEDDDILRQSAALDINNIHTVITENTVAVSGAFRGGPSWLQPHFGRRTDAVTHCHVS